MQLTIYINYYYSLQECLNLQFLAGVTSWETSFLEFSILQEFDKFGVFIDKKPLL